MRNVPKSLPRTIVPNTLKVKRRRLPRSHPSAMVGCFSFCGPDGNNQMEEVMLNVTVENIRELAVVGHPPDR